MLDLTWKIFCMTGSIDSYLLIREMEKEGEEQIPEKNISDVEEQAR
ncbi:YqzL family protein [Sporolactobacillus shoreae]|uniref:YqzL family protein n=1 Tax=Sporolactobacillus shoreae TaxID=1465501 RepID=A0A4Z0GRW8_9BACL|nr:YqzL family protein [Sporolactobacillus shoreae]TGA99590.1 YqzL family protein [Sporolactobacillus shoreae]